MSQVIYSMACYDRAISVALGAIDLVLMVPVSSDGSPGNGVVRTMRVSSSEVIEKSKLVTVHDVRVWTSSYTLPKLPNGLLDDA